MVKTVTVKPFGVGAGIGFNAAVFSFLDFDFDCDPDSDTDPDADNTVLAALGRSNVKAFGSARGYLLSQ